MLIGNSNDIHTSFINKSLISYLICKTRFISLIVLCRIVLRQVIVGNVIATTQLGFEKKRHHRFGPYILVTDTIG